MAAKKSAAKPKSSAKSPAGAIAAGTTLGDVVMRFPQAVPVMLSHGLHCVGCQVASFETVSQGAAAHGMDEERIKSLLKEMNEALK
ncbi:MAG: DUF1858 domain-containing protein [Candidatus Diapherotrites archaeon]|nr:DUF1858 domain-containing protein [Candidatus Diapherotrites archaeon]